MRNTGKRCGAPHPMYGKQVRCDAEANARGEHADAGAEHFNTFYMRRWDVEDAPRAPRRTRAVCYGGAAL